MKSKKTLILSVFIILISILCCSCYSIKTDNKYIDMVKNGHPVDYPNKTYKDSFEDFFASPKWTYFKSDDNRDVVEFTGICTYQNVEVNAKQQFILDVNNGTFEAGALSFNDVPQSNLITAVLISKVFGEDSTKANEDSTTTEDTNPVLKNDKQEETENRLTDNKADVKKYVIHNIFKDDISQISGLTICNPITVDGVTYYGIQYQHNNGAKLLCLDYTNKKTISYDEMDRILSPLGKHYWDLQN